MKTKPKRRHMTRPVNRSVSNALGAMAAMYVGEAVRMQAKQSIKGNVTFRGNLHRILDEILSLREKKIQHGLSLDEEGQLASKLSILKNTMLTIGDNAIPTRPPASSPKHAPQVDSVTVVAKLVKLLAFLVTSDLPEKELREGAFKLATEAASDAAQLPPSMDALNRYLRQCEFLAHAAISGRREELYKFISDGVVPNHVLELARQYLEGVAREKMFLDRLSNSESKNDEASRTIDAIIKLTETKDIRAALKKLRSWKNYGTFPQETKRNRSTICRSR
jgi:hypothetical protein